MPSARRMTLATLEHGPEPPRGGVVPIIAQPMPRFLDVMGNDARVWRYGLQSNAEGEATFVFYYGVGTPVPIGN